MVGTESCKAVIWLRRLCNEICVTTAGKLAKNPIKHGRTKHVDIKHHFMREVVETGKVQLEYVKTEHSIADIL